MSPDVHLACEPWGHVNHRDGNCECLSSDRMGAYVHDLALMPRECLTVPELEDSSVHTRGSDARMSHASGMGAGGAAGIGGIRVSSARRVWPPTPGCVCTVEDGPVVVI